MTISYSGKFGRLLFRWKASLWKTVWRELCLYLCLYYSISLVYRLALSPPQRRMFEKLVHYVDDSASSSIPISFLLGLYVVTVVKRWWEQFENIAWPDNFNYLVSAFFPGLDEERRILRRTLARYSVLAATLAWRNISSRVLKRFPTADHLHQAGLMTAEEAKMYQDTRAPFGRWFLPINWIQEIIISAKAKNTIDTAQTKQLMTAIHAYKDKFIRLFVFDWVTIPLAYTQVCTVATYGYFSLCLLGRQFVDQDLNHQHPQVFTILQFLFYMGWLKVGEKLMHPFGEEDDDFELNYLLDRHLFVSFMIVDDMHGQVPSMTKDAFWGEEPWLPHTKASQRIKDRRPVEHFHTNLRFLDMEVAAPKPKNM